MLPSPPVLLTYLTKLDLAMRIASPHRNTNDVPSEQEGSDPEGGGRGGGGRGGGGGGRGGEANHEGGFVRASRGLEHNCLGSLLHAGRALQACYLAPSSPIQHQRSEGQQARRESRREGEGVGAGAGAGAGAAGKAGGKQGQGQGQGQEPRGIDYQRVCIPVRHAGNVGLPTVSILNPQPPPPPPAAPAAPAATPPPPPPPPPHLSGTQGMDDCHTISSPPISSAFLQTPPPSSSTPYSSLLDSDSDTGSIGFTLPANTEPRAYSWWLREDTKRNESSCSRCESSST
eukprot:766087-Hanusia_phi.AAC.1